MSDNIPQLYLITPKRFELTPFLPLFEEMLGAVNITCVRLALLDERDGLLRAADALRPIAHQRDIPLVIDDQPGLALETGLDGVHLTNGHSALRAARKSLGKDAIIGCHCGNSKHSGMIAGEIGADYVSFGPIDPGADADDPAPIELFEWWSQMIELPVVAQGNISLENTAKIAAHSDFIALGDEIWQSDQPAQMLQQYEKLLLG